MKKVVIITLSLAIAFSSCKSQKASEQIILVNIRGLDRGQVAEILRELCANNSKVVGIDVIFRSKPSLEDNQLISALLTCNNMVVPSLIEGFDSGRESHHGFEPASDPEYMIDAKTGFANIIHESDSFGTVRRFSTREIVRGKVEYHFSVAIAWKFDSVTTKNYLSNNSRIVDVDYKSGRREFTTWTYDDFHLGRIEKNEIDGKIFLLGDLGQEDYDIFFSPLNRNGKRPDMYGLVYLANIVAQILETNH